MNCPTCAEPLAERGVFCKTCANQARCKKCRELLESNALACVECGTKIEGGNGTQHGGNGASSYQSGGSVAVNRNTLNYQEDRNSKRFEASLTDNAMQNLGDVFGELFAQRGVGRTANPGTRFSTNGVVDLVKQLPSVEELREVETRLPKSSPQDETSATHIAKIFNVNGEILELADNRLKAKTAADYYRRLTYLFLYGHEVLLSRNHAARSELNAILTTAKVYNGNCRGWLGQKNGFTVDAEDNMKLNAAGRDEAKKALIEIHDGAAEDVYHPDTRKSKPRGPRKKKS